MRPSPSVHHLPCTTYCATTYCATITYYVTAPVMCGAAMEVSESWVAPVLLLSNTFLLCTTYPAMVPETCRGAGAGWRLATVQHLYTVQRRRRRAERPWRCRRAAWHPSCCCAPPTRCLTRARTRPRTDPGSKNHLQNIRDNCKPCSESENAIRTTRQLTQRSILRSHASLETFSTSHANAKRNVKCKTLHLHLLWSVSPVCFA